MKGITKLDSCAINYRCYAQKGVHKILMTKSTSALKVQCTFQCETSSLKAETLFCRQTCWLAILIIFAFHPSHFPYYATFIMSVSVAVGCHPKQKPTPIGPGPNQWDACFGASSFVIINVGVNLSCQVPKCASIANLSLPKGNKSTAINSIEWRIWKVRFENVGLVNEFSYKINLYKVQKYLMML